MHSCFQSQSMSQHLQLFNSTGNLTFLVALRCKNDWTSCMVSYINLSLVYMNQIITSFKVAFLSTSARISTIREFDLDIHVMHTLIPLELIFCVDPSNLKCWCFFTKKKQCKICTQHHTHINKHQKRTKKATNTKCETLY